MNKKIKGNNGFTLIELVIAIAMLAFIMTAVSALMGSSVFSFRKSKANIAVQNTAQTTYDQLTDAIMQSKRVVIYGYIDESATSKVDFADAKSGSDVSGTYDAYYFVADEATQTLYGGDGSAKLFSDSSVEGKPIYVNKIIIDVSVPYTSITGADEVTVPDRLNNDAAVKIERAYVLDDSGNKNYLTDADGNNIYDTNDTVRYTYTFEDETLYREQEYSFNVADNYTFASDGKNNCTYCDSIKYLKNSDDSIEGCVVTVDSRNGALGLELHFDDKGLFYDVDGMVKIRNSNVLENN
ncbi:MAG: type II secretion system protein [Lachnospiraceae bacterium]|nr:type II secretion system protein [Lachnospiraceae bacterium]